MANDRERSVSEVLADIVDNFQRIALGEASLVVAQVVERATRASRAIGLLGAGVFLAVLAFGLLVVSAVVYLSGRLPVWQAAVVVAVPIALAAGAALGVGLRAIGRLRVPPPITVFQPGVTNGTEFSNHRGPSLARTGGLGTQRLRAREPGEGRH